MMNLRMEITGELSGNKTEGFLHQGWTCFCFYIINIIIQLFIYGYIQGQWCPENQE